jgi:hypothetical protein
MLPFNTSTFSYALGKGKLLLLPSMKNSMVNLKMYCNILPSSITNVNKLALPRISPLLIMKTLRPHPSTLPTLLAKWLVSKTPIVSPMATSSSILQTPL